MQTSPSLLSSASLSASRNSLRSGPSVVVLLESLKLERDNLLVVDLLGLMHPVYKRTEEKGLL